MNIKNKTRLIKELARQKTWCEPGITRKQITAAPFTLMKTLMRLSISKK
jgi:hypothetical protein